jgi:hypothetical protein
MAVPEGFKVVPFEGKDVYTTTLPKGTLLFRGVNDLSTIHRDIFGVLQDETYCLPPNYNVFFYPFPFVDSAVSDYSHLLVYVVIDDINLVTFISPSPMMRGDRHQAKGNPIVSCANIPKDEHGCNLVGRDYDPCFTPAFRKEYPALSGMIAIANMDRRNFMRIVTDYTVDTPLRSHLNKYLTTYVDATGNPGIPEIILHPLRARPDKDIRVSEKHKIKKWYETFAASASYRVWHTMERTDDAILEFLETITTEGLHKSVVKLDKRTGFYVSEKDADEETKKHLVDIKMGEEWSMTKDAPEFRFKKGALPMLNITKETYEKALADIEPRISNQIRTQSVGRTKYADRLAHVLAEVVLIVMATAAGLYYYDSSDEYGNETIHEDFCPVKGSYKECADLIDQAMKDFPLVDEGLPVNEEEYGERLDGRLEIGYTQNKTTEEVFEEWHPVVFDALLNGSYDKESQTYDRPKMITLAQTLATRLLRSTLELGYKQMTEKYDDPLPAKIVMDHLLEVRDLLKLTSDYGEKPGWVNDAFYRRFGAPAGYWYDTPDDRWGDWTDELEDDEEEEEEEEEEKPEGGQRRRTYRVRRTSLRRRR